MTQLNSSPPDCGAQDEIDLFDLLQSLWGYKVFIGLVAFVFAAAGWAYATYKPGQPDTYSAKAVLAVGSYVASTGQIFSLEPAGDLAQVINQTTGLKASLLRGSTGLVKISATAHAPKDAEELLGEVVEFVIKRHEAVGWLLGKEKIIRTTALIGDTKIQQSSLSEKRLEIIVLGVIVGLFLGSVAVLVWQSYVRRIKHAKARIEKESL